MRELQSVLGIEKRWRESYYTVMVGRSGVVRDVDGGGDRVSVARRKNFGREHRFQSEQGNAWESTNICDLSIFFRNL